MPLNLDYNARLGIYTLNGRPLDLTSFARAAAERIGILEERVRLLEEEAYAVASAKAKKAAEYSPEAEKKIIGDDLLSGELNIEGGKVKRGKKKKT